MRRELATEACAQRVDTEVRPVVASALLAARGIVQDEMGPLSRRRLVVAHEKDGDNEHDRERADGQGSSVGETTARTAATALLWPNDAPHRPRPAQAAAAAGRGP
jgi:hypothetical protein